MRAIDLVALHQADVLQPWRNRFDHIDHIDQHGEVRRYQLSPVRPVLIGCVEDVRHVREMHEFCLCIRRIQQIDSNMADLACCFAAATRQADDFPVTQLHEMCDEISADDAVGAYNNCFFGHFKISSSIPEPDMIHLCIFA